MTAAIASGCQFGANLRRCSSHTKYHQVTPQLGFTKHSQRAAYRDSLIKIALLSAILVIVKRSYRARELPRGHVKSRTSTSAQT
jgi:hypothetical protein